MERYGDIVMAPANSVLEDLDGFLKAGPCAGEIPQAPVNMAEASEAPPHRLMVWTKHLSSNTEGLLVKTLR